MTINTLKSHQMKIDLTKGDEKVIIYCTKMLFWGAKKTEKFIGTRCKPAIFEEKTYEEIIFEQISFGFFRVINSTLPDVGRKGTNNSR